MNFGSYAFWNVYLCEAHILQNMPIIVVSEMLLYKKIFCLLNFTAWNVKIPLGLVAGSYKNLAIFFSSSKEGCLKKRDAFGPTHWYALLEYSSLRSFIAHCVFVTTGTIGWGSHQREY